jgi:hypothetical protein
VNAKPSRAPARTLQPDAGRAQPTAPSDPSEPRSKPQRPFRWSSMEPFFLPLIPLSMNVVNGVYADRFFPLPGPLSPSPFSINWTSSPLPLPARAPSLTPCPAHRREARRRTVCVHQPFAGAPPVPVRAVHRPFAPRRPNAPPELRRPSSTIHAQRRASSVPSSLVLDVPRLTATKSLHEFGQTKLIHVLNHESCFKLIHCDLTSNIFNFKIMF